MPKLSPEKDFYHKNDPIRLSSDTPNAEIYYTLDGSDPAYKTGTLYKDPFTLDESCELRAVSCKEMTLADGTKTVLTSGIHSRTITVFPENWGDVKEEDRAQWGTSDLIPTGLWIAAASMPEPIYNGKAQKPDSFRVYYHNVLLVNKKDYTISYKNNTNAGKAQALFTFKTNLVGKGLVREFTIKAVPIAEALIAAETGIYTGSALTPKLSVRWNKKTLKEGTDYTVTSAGPLKEAGEYTVDVLGMGNFSGTAQCSFTIIKQGEKTDLSKAKIAAIPAQKYLPEGYKDASQLKDKKGNPLSLSVKVGKEVISSADYSTEIINGDKVGNATLRVIAKGTKTAGYKDIDFKIKGTDIKKAVSVAKIPDRPYTGKPWEPVPVVSSRTGIAIPEGAYTLTYSKNINAGTARVTLTGVEEQGFSGKMNVSFKITKPKLDALLATGALKLEYDKDTDFVKGGVKPAVKVSYKADEEWILLTEGKDYTIKYGNNKKEGLAGAGSKAPWLMLAGKGNFAGKTAKQNFTINAKNLKYVNAYAPDMIKGGDFEVKPVITDTNGKKLVIGTDLDRERMQYRYLENCSIKRGGKTVDIAAGSRIEKGDVMEIGTALEISIHAKEGSGYTGTLRIPYKVVEADLSKAKATITDQAYTGSEIRLGKAQIVLTIYGVPVPADNFEIIAYENNVKPGTAKVTVIGKNGYGGMKVLNFRIVKAPAGNWKAGFTCTE